MFKSKSVLTKSGKKVVLREPVIEDAKTFSKFINELIDEDTFVYISKQSKKDEEEYIKLLLDEIKKNIGVHIIADYKGEKVGGGDLINQGIKKEHVVELQLYIRKDFRGEGLGSSILRELENEAKKLSGVKTIILTSFSNNNSAIELYKKFGYAECGSLPLILKHKNEYVDEVFMYKHL